MENVNDEQTNQNENKNLMCNKCIYFHEHLTRQEKEKKSGPLESFFICLIIIVCFSIVWYIVAFKNGSDSDNWEIRITKTSHGIDVNYYDYDDLLDQSLEGIYSQY